MTNQMTNKICENCKWLREVNLAHEGFGECLVIEGMEDNNIFADMERATIYVGKNFGCIHFSAQLD